MTAGRNRLGGVTLGVAKEIPQMSSFAWPPDVEGNNIGLEIAAGRKQAKTGY